MLVGGYQVRGPMSITVWNTPIIGAPAKLCYLLVVNSLDSRSKSSSFMHPSTLNTIGAIVILLGVVIAGTVYWSGQAGSGSQATADSDWTDNTLSLQDSKSSTHDVEMYGGNLEMLMVKFTDAVKQPGAQAALILVVSILAALGCFVAARRRPPDRDVS
jgi:hypothetical protein